MKWNNWFSGIALVLSTIACFLTWLRVDVYVTNDTFVGIMAGFMGACATLIIGVQIYNSIDTRNTINELNNSFEKKIKELEQSIDTQLRDSRVLQNELNYELTNTNKELESAKKERKKNELILDAGIARCHGLSLHLIQPFTAFMSFKVALDLALEANDAGLINSCFDDLNTQTNKLFNELPSCDFSAMNLAKETDFNKFKKYPLYPLIQNQCERIQQVLQDRISEIIENQNNTK